jgi:small subunit ribosomal protein S27Ae
MSKKVTKKEEPPAEEPKKEEKKEEVKPPKVEKAKPEKKKKEERGVHALYKVENDKVTRLRPTCERCGPGYFMANHQDRYTCGHCGFTRYKQVEK